MNLFETTKINVSCHHLADILAFVTLTYPNSVIDINKAYTSDLLDIEYSPVFSVLDAFLDYDNHPVEDYTQYIIVSNESNTGAMVIN